MASRHFNCPSCSKEISIHSETCPNCGAVVDSGATRRFDPRNTPTTTYDSIDNARFVRYLQSSKILIQLSSE